MCDCGCEETIYIAKAYEDRYVVEYDVVCADCGKHLGLWSYGTYFPDNEYESEEW